MTQSGSSFHNTEIVLVHGGFSDGSIWREVILKLQKARFSVSAVQLPLNSVQDDCTALQQHLESKADQVLLVGHSYGGVVATEVAGKYSKVKALAYISSPVPDVDVPFGAFMQNFPAPVPVSLAPDGNGLLWASEELVKKSLGQDLSPEAQALFLAVQKPISVKIYSGKINYQGWKGRPVSYLVSEKDQLLAPSAQRQIAQKMGATIESVASGHLSLLSHPEQVSDFVIRSAGRITQT